MVVGMDGDITPVRHVVRLAIPGQQPGLLLFLEDHQWQTFGRSMDSLPGGLKTPQPGLLSNIGKAMEIATFEKALFHVTHAVFDFGFVLGVPYSRRVSEKSPALDILQETTGKPRIQRVHSGYGCREVIDDKVTGDAPEESPTCLQTFYDIAQLLTEHRPDEAMP